MRFVKNLVGIRIFRRTLLSSYYLIQCRIISYTHYSVYDRNFKDFFIYFNFFCSHPEVKSLFPL